jgi:hypothetical protein
MKLTADKPRGLSKLSECYIGLADLYKMAVMFIIFQLPTEFIFQFHDILKQRELSSAFFLWFLYNDRRRGILVRIPLGLINGRGDSLRWPRDTLYPLKLALTSPTSGGRSVGIVRWRTEAPELMLIPFGLDDFELDVFRTQVNFKVVVCVHFCFPYSNQGLMTRGAHGCFSLYLLLSPGYFWNITLK